MTKIKDNSFASASKKIKVCHKDRLIVMKTDFSLISRLLIASRRRPDVDVKFNISTYEFSALPKSLFGPDGRMLHCTNKSKLLSILESLPGTSIQQADEGNSSSVTNESPDLSGKKAAIIDGMALLHCYFKPAGLKTCEDLAKDFSNWLIKKFSCYDETHIVFDTYQANSLKNDTRVRRQQGNEPIHYKISADMKIASISMGKLLAHDKTKDDLTNFLSIQILKSAKIKKLKFIVSWRNNVQSSDGTDVQCLQTTQEEADTKMILHGVFVATKGVISTHIYSPDTDVVILALRRIPMLTAEVGMFIGQGMKKFIDLLPIYNALGPLKASALVGLHALSGADITGSFAHKGKPKWWKTFQSADNELLEALVQLGKTSLLPEDVRAQLEKCVCQLYLPKTTLTDIGDVRWWLFSKKQCQDENLPPTKAALNPALLRAHLQALVWNQDLVQFPETPSPINFGWQKVEDKYEPITSTIPCIPDLVWELCRCNCVKKRCTLPCVCRSQGLKCTEMCKCEGDASNCDNIESSDDEGEDEEAIDESSDSCDE